MALSPAAMVRTAAKTLAVAGAPLVVITGYTAYIGNSRSQPPPDLRFTIGSADDLLMEKVKTGDVILFNRSWTQMKPVGAVLACLKKLAYGSRFDHIGVIVCDRFGIPHVAEMTYSGVKLRRFDERILWSRSKEIALLPLSETCTWDRRALAERHVKGMALQRVYPVAMVELLGLLRLWKYRSNQSKEEDGKVPGDLDSGKDDDEMILGFIDPSLAVSTSVQVVLTTMERAGLVEMDDVAKKKDVLMYTTKDFEDAAVPLSRGGEFQDLFTVRIR